MVRKHILVANESTVSSLRIEVLEVVGKLDIEKTNAHVYWDFYLYVMDMMVNSAPFRIQCNIPSLLRKAWVVMFFRLGENFPFYIIFFYGCFRELYILVNIL